MRRLVALGLLIEAAYIVFLIGPFLLARHYAEPLLDLGKITGYRPWQAVVFAMVLVFFLYGLACQTAGEPRLARVVLAFAALFAVTQMFVYPIGALDVFDYIFFGREMAHYGANVYLVRPQDLAADPLYAYVGWKALPFTYGPVWALISGLLGRLGRADLLVNLFLFKSAAVAAYLVTGILVYRFLSQYSPHNTLHGTLFFAWNPLVVFESASNGHNDIIVTLWVMLGVAAFARGKRAAALGSLALSVLTKFVTAPLGLLWLAAGLRVESNVRARLRLLGCSVLLVGVLAGAAYLPFLSDRSHLRAVVLAPVLRQELFTSSFPALFVFATERPLGRDTAEKLARNSAILLLLVFTLFQAWRVQGTWQGMVRASCNVLLFYLLFLCLWFQPWYVIWVVPLAALLSPCRQATVTALFCFSAMTKYLVFDFFWFWSSVLTETPRIESVAVACIYGLPLAYLVSTLVTGRRRSARAVDHGSVLPELEVRS